MHINIQLKQVIPCQPLDLLLVTLDLILDTDNLCVAIRIELEPDSFDFT